MTAIEARDEIRRQRQILRRVQELIRVMGTGRGLTSPNALVLLKVEERIAREKIHELEALFK